MSSTAGAIIGGPIRPAAQSRLLVRLCSVLGLTALALLIFLAIAFAARRLAGEFSQPISGAGLVAVAAVTAILAVSARLAAGGRWRPSAQYSAIAAIASAILLAALTTSGTPAWGIAAAWFVLVASELRSWLALPR